MSDSEQRHAGRVGGAGGCSATSTSTPACRGRRRPRRRRVPDLLTEMAWGVGAGGPLSLRDRSPVVAGRPPWGAWTSSASTPPRHQTPASPTRRSTSWSSRSPPYRGGPAGLPPATRSRPSAPSATPPRGCRSDRQALHRFAVSTTTIAPWSRSSATAPRLASNSSLISLPPVEVIEIEQEHGRVNGPAPDAAGFRSRYQPTRSHDPGHGDHQDLAVVGGGEADVTGAQHRDRPPRGVAPPCFSGWWLWFRPGTSRRLGSAATAAHSPFRFGRAPQRLGDVLWHEIGELRDDLLRDMPSATMATTVATGDPQPGDARLAVHLLLRR